MVADVVEVVEIGVVTADPGVAWASTRGTHMISNKSTPEDQDLIMIQSLNGLDSLKNREISK